LQPHAEQSNQKSAPGISPHFWFVFLFFCRVSLKPARKRKRMKFMEGWRMLEMDGKRVVSFGNVKGKQGS
jgi:hypothetical protein